MSDSLSNDPTLYRAYRREIEGERLIRATRTAALVVILLSTAFIALDAVAYPDRFRHFLAIRLCLNAVLALIYLRTARTHPVASAMLGCLAIGGGLLAVIEGAGGLLGEYYVGLVLLFVGMPVFMPYSTRQAATLVAVLLGVLAICPFVGPEIDWRMYLLHLFFPAAAAVECVASCAVLDGFRFNDFLRRRELEEARDHLKQLDEEKSRFTANVHHELRTPLTLMLAPVEAMLSGEFGDVSDLQRTYLRTMHANGLRLLKLINNLLDLAKIEGGQLQVRRRPTSAGHIADELVAAARPLAQRKGIELGTAGLEALPLVNLDPEAFEKVVVNLLGNALKFTEPGGSIEVRGEATPEGGIHVVVADTGSGIPPEQLERIFDRFAQVDSSSTRRHEGTGIGLALVKELVELHGGRIWAESRGAGDGTRMHVVLPPGEADSEAAEEMLAGDDGREVARGSSIAAMEGELEVSSRSQEQLQTAEMERHVERVEDGASPPPAPAAAAPRTSGPEVLICEDNPDMRRLLAHLVGQEFRVRVASNGREGLAAVRERAPDLVLTDVMMPEMSGTELCRALKGDPQTRGIPVVLVTSKAEREMKIEGLELGADDYVTKPFHPRELLARVRSLLTLRGLQAELAVRNALLESTNAELHATLGELREASVRLVQAERLAAVGELAAGVAHEANNPMNFATNALRTLKAYVGDVQTVAAEIAAADWSEGRRAELAARELAKLTERLQLDELAAALSELVDIVIEGLERTQRLVGELRDFAAPGEGTRVPVDLLRSLRTTAQLVSHHLRQAGVELELELPERLPPVMGDPRALNQVFLNLLKNAADALAGRGGRVSVAAAWQEQEGVVRIRVCDDGPGISPEDLPRIFEPFFSTKGAGKGTGLGLSISRRILSEHGGSIELTSSPGAGVAALVSLPVEGERDAA